MLNLAHRGFSSKYPENSLSAFIQAIEAGADGLELDLQLSRDGQVMVFHDELLTRVTGHNSLLNDLTADQLADLKILASAEKIPRLDQVFNYFREAGKPIIYNLELKNGIMAYPGLEAKVLDLIDQFDLGRQVIISSFNHSSIKRLKAERPDLECGILCVAKLDCPASYVRSIGADYYHPLLESLDQETCLDLAQHEIGINAWTSADLDDRYLSLIKSAGLHAIISNHPDRLVQA